MACLLESKRLSLAGMQRSLRARVVEERRALHDVAPDRLMDWRRWRRPAPTPWDAADKAPAEVPVPAAKRARTSYEPVAADNRAFYDETLRYSTWIPDLWNSHMHMHMHKRLQGSDEPQQLAVQAGTLTILLR